MGTVVLGFLVAYTLLKTTGNVKTKLIRLLPFLLSLIDWRLLYSYLGFGAQGSSSYLDPAVNPLNFFIRAPFLRGRLFLGIPANVVSYFSTYLLPVALIIIILLLILLFIFLARYGSRDAAFWLISLLLALVPLAASSPTDRQLVFPLIGMTGLMLKLIRRFRENQTPLQHYRQLTAGLLVFILAINLITGIVTIVSTPATMSSLTHLSRNFIDFGEDPVLEQQQLVIVYPPAIHFLYSLSVQRLFSGQPLPVSLRVLSPGIVDVTVE